MDKSLDAGMQTFDQALFDLYTDGTLELDEAIRNADSPDGLELRVKLAEGANPADDSALDDMYDPTNF